MLHVAGINGRYRGPDRRKRLQEPPVAPTTELIKQVGLILAGVMVPSVLVWRSDAGLHTVSQVLQSLAGIALVGAGGALLMCWKIAGRAVPAWLGLAFADLGILTLAYGRLVTLASDETALTNPYGRLIPCVFAAAAVLAALRSPEVEAALNPIQAVLVSAPLGLVLLAVLGLATGWHAASGWTLMVTRSVCAAIWLATALLAFLARRRHPAVGPWIWVFLAVMGCAQGVAAVLGTDVAASAVLSVGYLTAACLALTAVIWELRWTLKGQERHTLDLRSVVDDLHQQLQTERQGLEEQLHDLRNAVSGIRLADATLRRAAARLDGETRARLADTLTAELSRLQALIEPDRALRLAPLSLEETLDPVLDTARTAGMDVDADVAGIAVVADRDALSQVLQNMLANARRYAPGSPVSVRAGLHPDGVRIKVSDEGPGVPGDERDTIFERGVRGSSAGDVPGSGLGLYVARRLMEEMGGDLYLEERPAGGACFVLQLPASLHPASGAGSQGVQYPGQALLAGPRP